MKDASNSVVSSEMDEILEKILQVGEPIKVVLFGSRARGDHHPDSDIDLLIVEQSSLPRYKRSPRYYKRQPCLRVEPLIPHQSNAAPCS